MTLGNKTITVVRIKKTILIDIVLQITANRRSGTTDRPKFVYLYFRRSLKNGGTYACVRDGSTRAVFEKDNFLELRAHISKFVSLAGPRKRVRNEREIDVSPLVLCAHGSDRKIPRRLGNDDENAVVFPVEFSGLAKLNIRGIRYRVRVFIVTR